MAININVNGESINYPQTGDTNWSDEATDFAVQTASAFGKIGLSSGTTVDILGTLDVTGNTTLDANLSVTGNATITGNLTANGNSNLGNASGDTIAVTGILNVDSGVLYVDPTNNRVGINDTTPSQALDVTGNVAITGNETVGGTLNVTGATSLSSTLGVTGDVAVNTNKFNITATSGNTTIAGTLGVTGDVAINTNKFNVTASSGNTTVAGTLGVTGDTTLNGKLLNSNGSAAAPSMSFSSDSDNGFYYIGANNFGISVGGSKVSDVSSNGLLNGTLGTDYRNLIQTVSNYTSAGATGSTTIPLDNTIPQITEGNQFMSLAITPKYSNSKLIIKSFAQLSSYGTGGLNMIICLFRVGTNDALVSAFQQIGTSGVLSYLQWQETSSSTSSRTYTLRAGNDSGTIAFNKPFNNNYLGLTLYSYMIIEEWI